MESVHLAVMLNELLSIISPKPNDIYLDMTVGAGGHAIALLEKSRLVIGLDRDREILEIARERLKSTAKEYHLQHSRYSRADKIMSDLGILQVNGVLFDLGVSSLQLDQGRRGFSFLREGPLDMRMGKDCSLDAKTILETYSEEKLAKLFFEYGEEPRSRKIARAIVNTRKAKPIKSTLELAALVAKTCGPRGRTHQATKIFQALRIAVNDELGELEIGLEKALSFLAPGGKIAVISFHSLEDRIVKRFFRAHKDCLEILTPKPLLPSREESRKNPRSRSAKLRCAAKIVN